MNESGRQILWNIDIPEPWRTLLMALLSLLPVLYVGWVLRERWKRWHLIGKAEAFPPREEWGRRAVRVFEHALGARRLKRREEAGRIHGFILASFLLLFVGTLIVALQHDIVGPLFDHVFFQGHFYRYYSITLEIAGLMGIAGCVLALRRRYCARPKSLGGKIDWAPTLWLLLAIMVTGFLIEGARIASHPAVAHTERLWSFAGYVVSRGIPADAAPLIHGALWWLHLAISIGFLCTFGGAAMGHIFTTCATVFLAREIPLGASPEPIHNIEEAEEYGVLSLEGFNQRHLRDADSCVECGRCQDVCPAHLTGKPLSPKKIVGAIRHGWLQLSEIAQRGDPIPAPDERHQLVGDLITADELWSCTTCGACEQECPVMIEQIEKIVEMRRGLVLMRSEFPDEVQTLFNNLEQSGNPWGKDAGERAQWAEEMDFAVPIVGDEGAADAEYLFWVGCAGSYDARAKKVTQAFARLMNRAGVKFAILGPAETCTGDSALRIGNEYLYQVLAKQNIETLNGAGAKKIVTTCPHCLQTLSKDYRKLGAEFDVVHHTQLIAELRADGRLSLADTEPPQRNGSERTAAIHDSCYLARHNRIIEEPREVAAAALGHPALEPPRHGDKGLCCGAGGGRMWMEEKLGHKSVNVERAEELVATGADTLVTNCPFCKTMVADGVKAIGGEGAVDVMDVAELLDARFTAAESPTEAAP